MREVDENLRRDRARDFAKRYGTWIIAGVVLFLVASGGYIFWKQQQIRKAEAQVEQLAQIYRAIANGNIRQAPAQLDSLAAESDEAIRASALFTRAAIAIEQRDIKLALAKYREVSGDEDMPQPYRDLALLRQTALEFDSMKPEDVIARMAPLAKPGQPWFGSAGEMTAAALLKQGKRDEAGRLFATIAKDNTVPDALRARAVQIAATLGVDASAALPATAQ
ncbi:tetratricopeptide repeat protein [Sphingomonas lutea]|uniref:Tetratricopeptide repeat protein n=1 Tax=Sphingomonas lutea TaxID=1045317 RepID=A0A7G9SHL6_9SPHN|nr:tetratricopeptide repeat protein [Sphingomonas lutea]QNN67341.1 tetratricopeptide repeat protein [Sphingomonas lutea]